MIGDLLASAHCCPPDFAPPRRLRLRATSTSACRPARRCRTRARSPRQMRAAARALPGSRERLSRSSATASTCALPRCASRWWTASERKTRQQQLQRQHGRRPLSDSRRAHPGRAGGNPGSGPLQIELTGDDSDLLAVAAAAGRARAARTCPGFSNVTTSASLLQPELVIRPRPERAAELGVTTAAISQATRIATSGDITNNLAKLNLPDRQIPIRVRLNDTRARDIDQIRLLHVPSRCGPVPLMNVADVSFGAGPAQITRYNRSRNITHLGRPRHDAAGRCAAAGRRDLPAMKNLPPGVRPVESGEARVHARDLRGLRRSRWSSASSASTRCWCCCSTTWCSRSPSCRRCRRRAGGAIVVLWLLQHGAVAAVADRPADADGHRHQELHPAGGVRGDGAPRAWPERATTRCSMPAPSARARS